jgi:hypothetical protein
MELQKTIKAEDYGLTEKQGFEISGKFKILEEDKKAIVRDYNEIIIKELTAELSSDAKLLDGRMQKHLKAKKDIHTANKSFFLNGGRFVDSIFNIEKVEFDIMRETTQKIKNYAEDLERERVAKIQKERVGLLSEFVEDANERDLSSMEEDVWQSYLATKKKTYLDKRQAELDAEKERQEKIQAEKEQQERIRKENAKLKAEAEAKEKALEQERKEAKAKQDSIELKAKQERELSEAKAEKLRKEQEIKEAKLKAEAEAKLKAEREERERLENQLKAQAEAEAKAEEERKDKIESELNKGDSEKVKDLLNDLEILKNKYAFKSVKNQKMYNGFIVLIGKIIEFINK